MVDVVTRGSHIKRYQLLWIILGSVLMVFRCSLEQKGGLKAKWKQFEPIHTHTHTQNVFGALC